MHPRVTILGALAPLVSRRFPGSAAGLFELQLRERRGRRRGRDRLGKLLELRRRELRCELRRREQQLRCGLQQQRLERRCELRQLLGQHRRRHDARHRAAEDERAHDGRLEPLLGRVGPRDLQRPGERRHRHGGLPLNAYLGSALGTDGTRFFFTQIKSGANEVDSVATDGTGSRRSPPARSASPPPTALDRRSSSSTERRTSTASPTSSPSLPATGVLPRPS